MRLYVDDLRKAPLGSVQVDNFDDAITLLCHIKFRELSLDHDLGLAETGYDIAKALEEEAFLKQGFLYIPDRIFCHSDNPVGRDNIEACIEKIEEYRNNG